MRIFYGYCVLPILFLSFFDSMDESRDVNNDVIPSHLYIRVYAENDTSIQDEPIFTRVEESPEYIGGDRAMYKFLKENIKFPEEAKQAKISGRVTLWFVIEKDGSIKIVKVLRGLGYGCDEEAVRLIKAMPKWKPGKQRGKAVRVYYTIPVIFSA